MKKYLLSVLAFAGALLVLTSCSAEKEDLTVEPVTKEEVTVVNEDTDLTVLVEKAVSEVNFGETLECQENAALSIYQMDGIAGDCYGYCGSATAEQIVVFKVNDGCMDKAEDAVTAQLRYMSENYASYAPDEVPKIDDAVVENYDNLLVVCISSDDEASEKLDMIFDY